MPGDSTIEWTEKTWNPIVGCSKVSPGCAHCYAELVHKTRLSGQGAYPDFKPWTPENAEHNVTLVPERLDQPIRWRKPAMIFVNSMSDLFHELVSGEYVAQVFAVMASAPQHTFQVLTKRPERMALMLADPEWRNRYALAIANLERPGFTPPLATPWPLPNVWLGTSIESWRFNGRADHVRRTPAAVRFISAEPLLGPVIVRCDCPGPTIAAGSHLPGCAAAYSLDLDGIDWLIVGGESGPEHRPMQIRWARHLRDAALHTETAFFFKQWGGQTAKANGRELDGRTWDEMPEAARIPA
jgi:protein gp37